MKKKLSALLFTAVALSVPAFAQPPSPNVDVDALRTAIKSDETKRSYVASSLQLSDAEAQKFWPLYDDYQRALDMNNRRRTRAIEDSLMGEKPVSDLYARRMATEVLAVEEAEAKALQKLYNRVVKVLPAKKAARYLQIESKAKAIEDYDIATVIPYVK